MKLLRFATFVLLFGLSAVALAAFPDKPIKIIVGFPPGGPLDTHARLLIDQLQKNLGQPVEPKSQINVVQRQRLILP